MGEMTTTTRIWVASVAISVGVGMAAALTVIQMGSQAEPGVVSAAQLLAAATLISVPLSLPLGLMGTVVLSLLLRFQKSRADLAVWIIRGVGVGGFLGALGSPVVPFLLDGGAASGRVSMMDPMFSLVGAAAGVIAGGIVAVLFYRVQETRTAHQAAV
jgi:hypothetical protein